MANVNFVKKVMNIKIDNVYQFVVMVYKLQRNNVMIRISLTMMDAILNAKLKMGLFATPNVI